jgi:acyl-CoA thioesterase-2
VTDLGDVLAVLDLQPAGDGRFTATSVDEGRGTVVFGGQLLAQSIVAAARTVSDKQVLSLHTVFARGASLAEPLDVEVELMQAGRAVASVTVTISQAGRLCTRSLVMLHAPDADLIRHADPTPAVSRPEELPERPGWWDIRIVDGVDLGDPAAVGPAELRVWTRFPGAPDDLTTSQALLAYASDGFLIGTAMRPHAGVGQSMAHVAISTTVLTQTIAFHDPFAAADWFLLDQRSSFAGNGRTQGAGAVFTADGRLVASFTQVNMVRDFPTGQAPATGQRAAH